eukprot:9301302-Alexandrium_andersonii.AAC.1
MLSPEWTTASPDPPTSHLQHASGALDGVGGGSPRSPPWGGVAQKAAPGTRRNPLRRAMRTLRRCCAIVVAPAPD